MDEEALETSLIGGFEPRRVEIVEYDGRWPEKFQEERAGLAAALGRTARRIEHIGSTAVPELAAKPVIDVLVTVDDVDEGSIKPIVEAAGYELRVREPAHLAFRRPDRSVNVHFYSDDAPEVDAYLVFRDHLRTSASDRLLYETRKRELAERDWPDVNFYAAAKSSVITEIMERARGGKPNPT